MEVPVKKIMFALLIAFSMAVPVPGQAQKLEEDPAATKLFKDARAARASWEGFPGFRADLIVNHNGQINKAQVEVSDTGKVTLALPDGEMKKFVREQIASLVGHRMGGAAKDTPCAFADK